VILDDAFHYLHARDLVGNHCTTPFATSKDLPCMSNSTKHVSGATHSADRVTNGTNGIHCINGTSCTNGINGLNGTSGTNGVNGVKRTNDTNGVNGINFNNSVNGRTVINGVNGRNGINGTSQTENTSKLLVLTAADEKALKRTIQGYESFYRDQISDSQTKVNQLAFTLASRRSQMLWRTFAVVNTGPGHREEGLSAAKPIRTSSESGVAFVFTGQGAQYVRMGLELIQYRVFEETLQRVDDIYQTLGCEWSIFGETCVPV
jgi:hypothetical protein